jgi:hypothetical protein
MRGREFLDVARDLAGGGTEAHWRAAVGCAYYALLLEARDALEHWGFPPIPRDKVHAQVRLRYTYAAHPELKDVGRALDELVRVRNQAQYQIGAGGLFGSRQKSSTAIATADAALAKLDHLAADPARRAAAVAALRASGS